MQIRRVVVLGGGISGLSAAFHLNEIAASREMPLEVTLVERAPRVGGSVDTFVRDGFVIETGADSFISEKPWGVALAKRLGIEHELIGTEEAFRKTFVVRNGKLEQIPEGFSLIAPSRLLPVLRSPIFTPLGKARMLLDLVLPRRPLASDDDDESLGDFVNRRLGREVLDRLVQALAGGIYTADPKLLSMRATMPRFLELERKHRSLIFGLRLQQSEATRNSSGARWSMFLSFTHGMKTLTSALAARLGDSLKPGCAAIALRRQENRWKQVKSWKVLLDDGTDLEADAVICATPSSVTARLLDQGAGEEGRDLAKDLRAIRYSSAAIVTLAYLKTDFPLAPASFGFVVPVVEGRRIIACSFSSLKFSGRAPSDTLLMRAFVGGALQHRMMDLDDHQMIDAARGELQQLFGVTGEPLLSHVERHPESMPQYQVGHLRHIAEIEQKARQLPGLALAGAFMHGVGIPDCIHSGETAAAAISEYLDSLSRRE